MKIKLYQIDAFTDRVFSGNPAAVCPLEEWLDDNILQDIAAENNLAETAYFVPDGNGFHIRWFTPKAEVDLCGHATLAAAYIIFNFSDYATQDIAFRSRSGELHVGKNGDWYTLDFPADRVKKVTLTTELRLCFDVRPMELYRGGSDFMLVYADRKMIENLKPNLVAIAGIKSRGIIVTARGSDTDFVSRFFAPQVGIDEDPVTGSAHTTLIPYWSKQLGKQELTARQVSTRGGYLKCKSLEDRVEISGQAAFYLAGEIRI